MKNSHIEWTDHTFNPWEGCTKVSPGCAHCYAETRNARFGGGTAPNWGPGAPRRRTSASNWREPLKWEREAAEALNAFEQHSILHDGQPHCAPPARPRVFCASLADWLDDEVPLDWLAELLGLIRDTPHLDWLLLTKRPQNWRPRLSALIGMTISQERNGVDQCFGIALAARWLNGAPPANVWIGTTVEDQCRADERAHLFLEIPAVVHFVSAEPLLGPVDLSFAFPGRGVRRAPAGGVERFPVPGIDWIIAGGESGAHARPMHPEWARSLRDQCAAHGVAFLFKQWGEWAPAESAADLSGRLSTATFGASGWHFSTQTEKQSEECHADDAPDLYRVGKKSAGRLLDGVEHNGFPTPSASAPLAPFRGHPSASELTA